MRKPDWTIDYLRSKIGSPHFERKARTQWFPSPHTAVWPEDKECFRESARELEEALPESIRPFYIQALIACLLLDRGKAPEQALSWLASRAELYGLLAGWSSLEQLRELNWTAAPVALVGTGDKGWSTVRILLAGRGDGSLPDACLPSWAHKVFDAGARSAIENAARAAERRFPGRRFSFWPVVDCSSPVCVVNGPSAGLSAYLAAFSLAQEAPVPDILPTGSVTAQGELEEVGGLDEKLRLAGEKGFPAFMYPSIASFTALQDGVPGKTQVFPVATLREAEIIWTRYSTGYAREFAEFDRLFSDPCRLLTAIPDQLAAILEKNERDIGETIMQSISGGRPEILGALDIFARKAEQQMKKPDRDLEKLSLVMKPLDQRLVAEIANHNAALAFRLALLRISLANHQGETALQKQWEKLAFRICEMIRDHDADIYKLEFLVKLFVGEVHNRYSFTNGIPDSFAKEFEKVAKYLEEGYKRMKERRGGPCVHYELGCYYGTMMQHFAFNGPACIDDRTLWFSQKALEAFGDGDDRRYLDDYLRQYCYLAYALLDDGSFDEAEEAMLKYLRVESLDHFKYGEASDPYKHALLSRFLADTGRPFPEYQEWAGRDMVKKNGLDKHPWQLWFYNMGRLSGERGVKERYWERSASICNQPGRPAIQVMGLLPLSELYLAGMSSPEAMGDGVRRIMTVVEEGCLDTRHFQVLLPVKDDWKAVLQTARRHISTLFPFNYR